MIWMMRRVGLVGPERTTSPPQSVGAGIPRGRGIHRRWTDDLLLMTLSAPQLIKGLRARRRSAEALSGYRASGSLLPETARSATTSRRNRNNFAGRPRVSSPSADLLHQFLLLDQPAEILLVQPPPRERFHRALQLQQGEFVAASIRTPRAIFDLRAKPRDTGGQDTPMVVRHRLARDRRSLRASGTNPASHSSS